ncbi:MAG: dTDP-glucose 4,6-dehydratase [Candidatus Omnitrophota bacterium]
MKNRKNKILVTGGAGFIGSEFVRLVIKKGYRPVVVDSLTYAGDLKRLNEVKGRYKFCKIDICDKNKLEKVFRKEKPSVVVHFAAATHVDRSIVSPGTFINTNIKGTQNLLDISRNIKIDKFVYVSTDEVYGEIKKGSFYENSPIVANSPYAVSKAAADMFVRAYYRTYKMPVVVARPCNNYGPWQYPEKLIPVVIMSAINKKKIPVYGKGLNVREWLYVSDCAEAIFTIFRKGKIGEAYNIGSGKEKKNLDLVKLICKILDRVKPLNSSKTKTKSYKYLISFVKDRPGHDLRYSLNSNKIYRKLGWKAKANFNSSLEKTIGWFVANKKWWLNKIG